MENIISRSSTMPRAIEIHIDKLAIDPSLLNLKASFSDDLGVDSLDLYELFSAYEKEFNISIPDEDAEKLKTVGSLIDYLDKHVN